MVTRRPHHERCILFPLAALLAVSALGSGRAPAQDCNNNGIPDECAPRVLGLDIKRGRRAHGPDSRRQRPFSLQFEWVILVKWRFDVR